MHLYIFSVRSVRMIRSALKRVVGIFETKAKNRGEDKSNETFRRSESNVPVLHAHGAYGGQSNEKSADVEDQDEAMENTRES